MSRARTLLVAVNDVFLDGVVDWVAGDAQIEVVGRTHSGLQALEEVVSLGADLLFVDVTLPDMSGFELVRRIKSRPHAPLVVMFSFYDSHAARREASKAGADGFVLKSETAECLMPLVGELLRQRKPMVREESSSIRTMRKPPTDVTT